MTESASSATPAEANPMEDFIFGTLATTTDRVESMIENLRALSAPTPDLVDGALKLSVTAGPEAPVEDVIVYFTVDGSDPVPGHPGTASLTLYEHRPVWNTLLWAYLRTFSITFSEDVLPLDAVLRYRVAGKTRRGDLIWAANGRRFSHFNAEYVNYRVPEWVRKAVIYHIFVDRFAPPPGGRFAEHENPSAFFGGTLRGILSRLDYLTDLGVNALWLSPIFPSPSHHGYDATDFREVEPRLGTKADFRALVKAAHARGIRILLDFVPNHTSNEHPFFQSASSDPQSPYRDYYVFRQWPDQYDSFFGVKSLPQINNESPEARRYVIDSAIYWLREFGVDGFRLDYAFGPSLDFWLDYYAAVKKENPESFHVGEIVETPGLIRGYAGRLDGALDFHFLQMIRKTFAFGTLDVERFDDWLHRHEAYFSGSNFILPTFLDNHDMNRFLWVARGDTRRLKLAALVQFTLPATPIVYYGTEIGLSQVRDARQNGRGIPEESRLPMPWDDQDADLLAFYRRLIAIRHQIVESLGNFCNTLVADAATGLYSYSYADTRHDPGLIVALNNSAHTQKLHLDVPGTWHDLFSGERYIASQKRLTIPLEPYSGTILRAE